MRKVLIVVMLLSVFAPIAVSQIQTAKVTGGEVQGVVTGGISIFKGIRRFIGKHHSNNS